MMNRCCTVVSRERDTDPEEWGDEGRDVVRWQVSSTSVACLQAEAHHTFETLVCCSSNKIPLPQKESKISVCTWIFVQNKDGSYPASAWSRLWGGHPAPGGCVSKPGGWALSPTSGQYGFGGDTLPWQVPSPQPGHSHCQWHQGEEWHHEGSRRKVWCCTASCSGVPTDTPTPTKLLPVRFLFLFFLRWHP